MHYRMSGRNMQNQSDSWGPRMHRQKYKGREGKKKTDKKNLYRWRFAKMGNTQISHFAGWRTMIEERCRELRLLNGEISHIPQFSFCCPRGGEFLPFRKIAYPPNCHRPFTRYSAKKYKAEKEQNNCKLLAQTTAPSRLLLQAFPPHIRTMKEFHFHIIRTYFCWKRRRGMARRSTNRLLPIPTFLVFLWFLSSIFTMSLNRNVGKVSFMRGSQM